jgi:hypothetical protein
VQLEREADNSNQIDRDQTRSASDHDASSGSREGYPTKGLGVGRAVHCQTLVERNRKVCFNFKFKLKIIWVGLQQYDEGKRPGRVQVLVVEIKFEKDCRGMKANE